MAKTSLLVAFDFKWSPSLLGRPGIAAWDFGTLRPFNASLFVSTWEDRVLLLPCQPETCIRAEPTPSLRVAFVRFFDSLCSALRLALTAIVSFCETSRDRVDHR